jgi:hypothetical protein
MTLTKNPVTNKTWKPPDKGQPRVPTQDVNIEASKIAWQLVDFGGYAG